MEVALYDIEKDIPGGKEFRQDITSLAGVPTTPETVFVSGEKLKSMEEIPLKGEIAFKEGWKKKLK